MFEEMLSENEKSNDYTYNSIRGRLFRRFKNSRSADLTRKKADQHSLLILEGAKRCRSEKTSDWSTKNRYSVEN